jgi:hypothetical protein
MMVNVSAYFERNREAREFSRRRQASGRIDLLA